MNNSDTYLKMAWQAIQNGLYLDEGHSVVETDPSYLADLEAFMADVDLRLWNTLQPVRGYHEWKFNPNRP